MQDSKGCREISVWGLVDRSCHACLLSLEKIIFLGTHVLQIFLDTSYYTAKLFLPFVLSLPPPPTLETNAFKVLIP